MDTTMSNAAPSPVLYEPPGLRSKNKSVFRSFHGTIHHYAEIATVHGLSYIFNNKLPSVERFLWLLVMIFFTGLSVYWIQDAYFKWKDSPIITSVSSTGKPIFQLEYPAITICSQGVIRKVVKNAASKQFYDYVSLNYPDIDFESFSTKQKMVFTMKITREMYPNSTYTAPALALAMASHNPLDAVRSRIMVQRGFDHCEGAAEDFQEKCEEGWTDQDGYCFLLLRTMLSKKSNPCPGLGAYQLGFSKDEPELPNILLSFLAKQPDWMDDLWLSVLPSEGKLFFTCKKDAVTNFATYLTTDNPYDPSKPFCGARAKYDKIINKLMYEVLYCTDTGEPRLAMNLCYKKKESCKAGSTREESYGGPTGPSALDFMFDPIWRERVKAETAMARKSETRRFKRMNITQIYENLMEILWYTQLPCFDVEGVTSEQDMENGLLKACFWNGIQLPCSEIFVTSPTDRGMCCTFNLDEAEKMFKKGPFTKIINKMQRRDQNLSFPLSSEPSHDWENPFANDGRPEPQSGKSKGLSLILDAHTDKVAPSSVHDDFDGFIAIVDSSNQFPMTLKRSVMIRPGHNNMVSLKATKVTTEKNVIKVEPSKRQCFFSRDMKLELHNSYSQSNCILECNLKYSFRQMAEDEKCIPWYFPIKNHSIPMCNPWQAYDFITIMKNIPQSECLYCLPDCTTTLYEASVSAVPFRECDGRNFGISNLCSYNGEEGRLLNPPRWGQNVLDEYIPVYGQIKTLPDFIKDKFQSNIRYRRGSILESEVIFKKANLRRPTYDAYEKDIAMVTFFFESTTSFEYVRQIRMTTVDFISQLGGLLGLCLGFSFISIIELAYWFTLVFGRNHFRIE